VVSVQEDAVVEQNLSRSADLELVCSMMELKHELSAEVDDSSVEVRNEEHLSEIPEGMTEEFALCGEVVRTRVEL
jgi:hypothetical protein